MTSTLTFSKLATIGFWLAFAVACGGRVTTDPNTTGSTSGTSDPGNSTTTGTTTTTTGDMGDTGGSTNGSNAGGSETTTGGVITTSGSGGVTGAGGDVISCGPCGAIACPPGTYSSVLPGACCPTCVPCSVACKSCPPGTHPQAVPDQCCGTCVVDPQSCESGRMGYEAFRLQLLDKYSSPGCTVDANCTIASEINHCVARCGVALPVVTAGDWKSNTISYADSNCSNCPASARPPCAAFQARCIMGKCTLGAPGAAPQ